MHIEGQIIWDRKYSGGCQVEGYGDGELLFNGYTVSI